MRDCDHPDIVRLLGWRQTTFDFQLIFELCEADLRARSARQPLAASAVRRWTLHVSRGLAFLHTKDTLHRDVKPSNVFLRGQPLATVVLGDFGLARVVSKSDPTTATVPNL